ERSRKSHGQRSRYRPMERSTIKNATCRGLIIHSLHGMRNPVKRSQKSLRKSQNLRIREKRATNPTLQAIIIQPLHRKSSHKMSRIHLNRKNQINQRKSWNSLFQRDRKSNPLQDRKSVV